MPLEKLTRQRIINALNLLAMKCLACRSGLPGYPGDIDDLRFLIRKMGIRTLEQIDEHIGRFYPHDALTPPARAIISGLLIAPESPKP